ncbi:MAG: hypothetical protein WC455_19985 [Dehalococcoidia bacterium]|jgi:hypothetical protein
MIRSDAKLLHSFKLNNFSGGINTDSQGTEKELLQCLNSVITPKGHIAKRGGSKLLNQFAPIGYQEKEVWGYLFGCDETQDEYTETFLGVAGGVPSANIYTSDAANVVDKDASTCWQAKDLYAWAQEYDSDANPIYDVHRFVGSLYAAGTTGVFKRTGTTWTKVDSVTNFECHCLEEHGGYLYAGYVPTGSAPNQYFLVRKSVDGNVWTTSVATTWLGAAGGCFSLKSVGSKLFGGCFQTGFCYTENGTDWSRNAWGGTIASGKFWGAELGDLLYGVCHSEKKVYKRAAAGTWSLVYTVPGFVDANDAINGIYTTDSFLYIFGVEKDGVTYNGRLMRSANGTDWTDLGIAGTGAGGILAMVEYGSLLLCTIGAVVYQSADNGATWTVYYGSLPHSVYSLNVDDPGVFLDDVLYCSGTDGEIWKYYNSMSYTDNWLKYSLPVAKTARKMAITSYDSGVRLFTLYGSNDGTNYTSIYASICDEGNARQEFLFANATAYLYYKLVINTAHGDHIAGVNEWELMELTASADKNYYIFKKTAKDIIRKVTFPSLQSMLNFISYWKAKNIGWATDYYCTASDFDIDDNGDVSTKVIAEGEFTALNFSEAILDSKINKYMSVFALLRDERNNEMFGVPQAWKIMSESTAITSMHELKRRDLKQVYTYDEITGVLAAEDAEPKEYIQNKFIFATADNAILTANHNTDLSINGFNVLKTGLKRGANCCWVNFQNRAFMVNGAEDDCDMIWTNGEDVYNIGVTAPATAPTGAANAATGGFMADGDYYFKYLYHRTTYGGNNSGFSPEVKVTLALGKGEIETFTFTGGTGYAVGQILTAVQSGASGGTFRVDTVDSAGVILSLTQLEEGALYSVANGLATTVNTGSGSAATISVLTITDVAKTQKETFNVLPSSDPQVDKIYLYRTKLNDYVFYKCAEIDNVYDPLNPATTLPISSTVNDNSLAVGDLADDSYGVPPQSKFIAVGGNKMFYATESAIYFSKLNFPEDLPDVNYIPVSEDDGERITAIGVVGTWLLVCKETRTFAIDVNEPMSIPPIMINDTLGCIDYKTFRVAEGQVAIWISQVGPCVSNGTSVLVISKGKASEDGLVIGKIYDDFANNFDHSKNSEAFGIYYPKRQQYWFHVPYLGGYYRTWIYDFQISAFYKFSFPIEAENYILLTDDDNTQRLISTFTKVDTAKYYGYIMIYDEATYQDTSAITLTGVETKTDISMDVITTWLSLGLAERIKSFRMIYAEVYAAAAATLTISCGIDHKRMESKQILLNGSIDTTASVNVVGVGTYFLTELKVGDSIVVGSETRIIATITDDTHLTVTLAFSNQANDTSIYKIGPGIHTATITHPGEVGTAPTSGKDEIEGFDYGRVRSLPSPVDGVGTYFSIRMQHTGSMALTLFGYTILFRLRGARP